MKENASERVEKVQKHEQNVVKRDFEKDPLRSDDTPDTRAQVKRILGQVDRTSQKSTIKILSCLVVALLVFNLPRMLGYNGFEGLSRSGEVALIILIFSAGLWVTEAIPAFAVGLLVIALNIALLGREGGVFALAGEHDKWHIFVKPWSSPLMWIFFGGFVLASAVSKTKLDIWLSKNLLGLFGSRPKRILGGFMLITFTLSMFMSNTATAAMMMTLVIPLACKFGKDDQFGKALILSIPISANLGGMGTLIGTPPNAIAAAQLPDDAKISFFEWMLAALPPAFVLLVVAWLFLLFKFKTDRKEISIDQLFDNNDNIEQNPNEIHHRKIVMIGFLITVILWMTSGIHGVSAAVVAFIPITLFSSTGILTSKDVRSLPWEVLLMLAGGLALGVAVRETGLGAWLASLIPGKFPLIIITIIFTTLTVVLSNLMSNTAAASILLPIALGLAGSAPQIMMIPLALACSCAMMLPISTPPNAIVFSSGLIKNKDFMQIGLIMGILGPILCILWAWIYF